MTVRSRTYLKGKFETGDRPTEQDLSDMIDSALNRNDDMLKGTFTNADLITVTLEGIDHEVLEVEHNFDTSNYTLVVRDEDYSLMQVTDYPIDSNNTYIIIDDTITGTWTYFLLK